MLFNRNLWRLTFVAVCVFSALAISAQQSPPVDVSVLLSATDKYDRVITNLTKDDVRIFEEGSLRRIDRFESADGLPISMEVLIDTSISTKNQSEAVPVLAKLFLEMTIRKGKDTATISSLGKSGRLVQSATDDIAQLHSAIDKISMGTAGGNSALSATVMDAANRLSAAPGRRIVLLVSVGMDSNSRWKRMIETLQKHDVAVYPMYCFWDRPLPPGEFRPPKFSLESWGSMTELAKATGGIPYLPKNVDAQAAERDLRQIAREISSQRIVSFQPGSRKNSQTLRKIRIEVANPQLKGLKLKYRQRY
jgi:VWFA-related protein